MKFDFSLVYSIEGMGLLGRPIRIYRAIIKMDLREKDGSMDWIILPLLFLPYFFFPCSSSHSCCF
jgi:hypothetical protein